VTPELPFQAVIFDMDGLVLDSETGYFDAWLQAADSLGCPLDLSFCASLSGAHGQQINRRLLAHFGDEFALQSFYALSAQIWREQVQRSGIPLKSGFYKVLEIVKGLQLPYCLATNSRRDDALACLRWAGLDDVFPTILAREDVSKPKPAADIFLKAAALFHTNPQNCLVLEDSPIGIDAAVAAGCPCFYVPSIAPADPVAATLANRVFGDLAAVADFISEAFHHPL
jgi:HAD superfamily hydrolase (TIGR01509 family)